MKKKGPIIIAVAVIIVLAVNAFVYISILNGSNTIANLIRKSGFAFVTPNTYIGLAQKLYKKPHYSNIKQLELTITERSDEFIKAAFGLNSEAIEQMLDKSAQYIKSKDGSSFIRYIDNGVHVEGYMATDRKLIKAKPRWHVLEEDNTVTCSMEVYIEGSKSPQLWYLHFRKVKNDWKLYMLENDL